MKNPHRLAAIVGAFVIACLLCGCANLSPESIKGQQRSEAILAEPLSIHWSGCPNSCGQHWISDIDLRGRRMRTETGSEEGFSIYVGGRLDAAGHVGDLAMEVAATDIVPAIRAMLTVYLQNRSAPEERFGDYARWVGGKELGEQALAVLEAGQHEPANMRNLRLRAVLHQAFEEARGS